MNNSQEFWIYLFVIDQYVQCAKLTITDDNYQLRYSKDYLSNPNAFALDPQNLPLYAKNYQSTELFAAIRDSAPDYWGRELLKRKFNSSELSELEYVFANRLEHVGAMAFSPIKHHQPMKLTPSGWQNHIQKQVVLEQIMQQTEWLISDAEGIKLKELFEFGPTLGGGRPKVSLMTDENMFLAKYGTSLDSMPEQKIEYATMLMAQDLGLNVPVVKISKHMGRDVFMIKRFDRDIVDKQIHRHHFISALSLCDWHEFGRSEWSYPVFCEFLRKSAKTELQVKQDLHELFKRIAFNIAVNNDDDHPRNHGLMLTDGIWRLAPLYDVVPKAISGETFSLAMNMGNYGRQASNKNLLSVHQYFELDVKMATQIIAEVNAFVQTNWQTYFKQAEISMRVINQFKNAMQVKA